MARKNNPQQTIDTIIDKGAALFIQKGYEKTSMQDLVDAIGMSKGAIFHHFKSKEDIFQAVMHQQAEYARQVIDQWLTEMHALPAREKMTGILERSLRDRRLRSTDAMLSTRITDPHFVLATMQDSVTKSAPIFARLIQEGLEDGSITTAYPDEVAEAFFLLLNIWCDPMIFQGDRRRLERRLRVTQNVMAELGVDIVTDQLITDTLAYLDQLYPGGPDGQ